MTEFTESSAEIKSRAARYAASGDYRRAIQEYERILTTTPDDPDMLNLVGDTYRKVGARDKAVEMFDRAVELYAAQAYYDNAIAICKKILRIDPDRSEVMKTLAELYMNQGLSGQATSFLVEYAVKKKEDGDYESMVDAYKSLIDIRPEDIGLRMKLADEYIGLGRLGDACTQLQEISILYKKEGRYEEVVNIEKLIREITSPDDEWVVEDYVERAKNAEESGETDEAAGYYYQAGELYLKQATYHQAKDVFLKVAQLKPQELKPWQRLIQMAERLDDRRSEMGAYFGLASALVERGAMDSAASVYRRILSTEPGNEEAVRALEAMGRGDLVQAEVSSEHGEGEALEAAVEHATDRPVFKVAEEESQGQPISLDDLMSAFRSGVEENISKDDYSTHYDLGVSFKEMGRLDEAISHLKKAAEGDKERLKAHELLGRCYTEKGDIDTAIDWFQKGFSLDGYSDQEYLGLRYGLGMAYEAVGRMDDALREYRAIESAVANYFDVPERIAKIEDGNSEDETPTEELPED